MNLKTKKVLSNIDEALKVLTEELNSRVDYYWTMKDGTEIPVREMSDKHIINTINMLEKRKEFQEIAAEYKQYVWELD